MSFYFPWNFLFDAWIKCLEIFLLSLCYLFLAGFHCAGDHTAFSIIFNLLSFVSWPRRWSILSVLCGHLKRKRVCCDWVGCSINVALILWAEGVVEFFSALTYFSVELSYCRTSSVGVSNYTCGFVRFSLSFSQSFWSYVLQLWCHSCSFRIVMYCWCIDTNTGTLAFFWLMFTWYNISHLFLSIHLYLYSWSGSLVVHLCCSIHSVSLCLLIGMFMPFIYNVIIDMLGLKKGMPFYFLFSVCPFWVLLISVLYPAFLWVTWKNFCRLSFCSICSFFERISLYYCYFSGCCRYYTAHM